MCIVQRVNVSAQHTKFRLLKVGAMRVPSFAGIFCWIFFGAVAFAASPWTGILAPARATDWSTAGVAGGIPTSRTTVCATMSPGQTVAQINSAIASCPSGQVVQFGGGTFNLSGTINIYRSDVTLRGQGMSTILNFTNSGGSNYYWGSTLIAVQHSQFDQSGDPSAPGIGGVPASTIRNWMGTNG